jgi:hypothetical protein
MRENSGFSAASEFPDPRSLNGHSMEFIHKSTRPLGDYAHPGQLVDLPDYSSSSGYRHASGVNAVAKEVLALIVAFIRYAIEQGLLHSTLFDGANHQRFE